MADESPKAHLPLKLPKLPKVPILPCSRKSFPQLPPRTPPPAPVLCAGGGEPFSSTRAHGVGGRSSFMVLREHLPPPCKQPPQRAVK